MNQIDNARATIENANAELSMGAPDLGSVMSHARALALRRIRIAFTVGAIGAIVLLAGGLIARANGNGGASGGGSVGTESSHHRTSHEKEGEGQPEAEERQRESEHKKTTEETEEHREPKPKPLANLGVDLEAGQAIRVVIGNDSSVAAGPFEVMATVDGEEVGRQEVSGLEAGQSTTLYFKCNGETMTVTVDPGNEVAESSDADNSATANCATETTPSSTSGAGTGTTTEETSEAPPEAVP